MKENGEVKAREIETRRKESLQQEQMERKHALQRQREEERAAALAAGKEYEPQTMTPSQSQTSVRLHYSGDSRSQLIPTKLSKAELKKRKKAEKQEKEQRKKDERKQKELEKKRKKEMKRKGTAGEIELGNDGLLYVMGQTDGNAEEEHQQTLYEPPSEDGPSSLISTGSRAVDAVSQESRQPQLATAISQVAVVEAKGRAAASSTLQAEDPDSDLYLAPAETMTSTAVSSNEIAVAGAAVETEEMYLEPGDQPKREGSTYDDMMYGDFTPSAVEPPPPLDEEMSKRRSDISDENAVEYRNICSYGDEDELTNRTYTNEGAKPEDMAPDIIYEEGVDTCDATSPGDPSYTNTDHKPMLARDSASTLYEDMPVASAKASASQSDGGELYELIPGQMEPQPQSSAVSMQRGSSLPPPPASDQPALPPRPPKVDSPALPPRDRHSTLARPESATQQYKNVTNPARPMEDYTEMYADCDELAATIVGHNSTSRPVSSMTTQSVGLQQSSFAPQERPMGDAAENESGQSEGGLVYMDMQQNAAKAPGNELYEAMMADDEAVGDTFYDISGQGSASQDQDNAGDVYMDMAQQ